MVASLLSPLQMLTGLEVLPLLVLLLLIVIIVMPRR